LQIELQILPAPTNALLYIVYLIINLLLHVLA